MSYQKVADLLIALKERTDAGDLPWAETEERGVFQASFSNFAVRLYQDVNPYNDDEVDYVFQIINETGDVVEAIRDPDMAQWFEKPFVFMRELFESARRRAMGVDDAIDQIMRALKGA